MGKDWNFFSEEANHPGRHWKGQNALRITQVMLGGGAAAVVLPWVVKIMWILGDETDAKHLHEGITPIFNV